MDISPAKTTIPHTGLATASQSFASLRTGSFLDWLSAWVSNLGTLNLESYLREKGVNPDDVAVISADLVEGFCYHGPLASPRIADIVQPSADLMQRAYALGVRQF